MDQKPGYNHSILITGGTSGLGLELVKRFLAEGYEVIATGRQTININGFPGKFFLYKVDFGDLGQVRETAFEISGNHSVSTIINNAGILSPPKYTQTADRLECTFQINFLAHLLLDKIILQSYTDAPPIVIASVTSPVYRMAGNKTGISQGAEDYSAIRSYSYSKFFLTMLHEFLASDNHNDDFHGFSFNPGTFSSGIYRMQKSWFRIIYRIAAPFMRSPAMVAGVLSELLLNENPEDGMIYDISKRKKAVPLMEKSQKDALISRCNELIDPFLRQAGALKL
jgi:NAD(P)-dependent dehydrogenase (short-subunit alcohol dehydrogenase family)